MQLFPPSGKRGACSHNALPKTWVGIFMPGEDFWGLWCILFIVETYGKCKEDAYKNAHFLPPKKQSRSPKFPCRAIRLEEVSTTNRRMDKKRDNNLRKIFGTCQTPAPLLPRLRTTPGTQTGNFHSGLFLLGFVRFFEKVRHRSRRGDTPRTSRLKNKKREKERRSSRKIGF